MTSVFPPIPRVIFCYLEPLSLVGGFLAPLVDPASFVSGQIPQEQVHALYRTEHLLALQLGNLYGLMCLVGLAVLNTTTESRVVRTYIWALWVADITHVALSIWGMSWSGFLDIASWNALAYGNIGATCALFACRSLYLLGVFGKDRTPQSSLSKKIR